MKLRFATVEDAPVLLEIYRQYIDTTITFEYELPSVEEFGKRIQEYSEMYPYFLCEEEGRCVGYVYAHKAQERAAYQWNAELSIYLDENYRGRKIGVRLYQMMEELLKLQGVKTLYGLVTTPNPRSERLHLQTGFLLAGRYHNTGYKKNTWCDVLLFEKSIGDYGDAPTPIKSIREISTDTITELIEKFGFTTE